MKIGVIVQARTGSNRLPEKVLKDLPFGSGITVLEQDIRRLKKSQKTDEIIIATTTKPEDERIVNIAKKEGVKFFRGSVKDVLARYYLSAREFNIDIVIRVTSDCPCIDWDIVDMLVDEHINNNADYTSNTIKRTFPHGLDVEVVNVDALEQAYFNAKEPFEREHVLPYISRTHSRLFKLHSVEAESNLFAPDIRITLDTEEDYALLCAVYDYLYRENNFFDTNDIIKLFADKPWLKIINKKILQKKKFNSFEEEIAEAVKLLELQDLNNVKQFLLEKISDGK